MRTTLVVLAILVGFLLAAKIHGRQLLAERVATRNTEDMR
jgi:hypothetical protein